MTLRSSVMLMLLLPIVAAAQTLSIRSDTWYPMNGDPQGDKPGFMIEMAKAIFEPRGITIDYQLMPWERAIHEVRAGRVDCVVGAYTEDAPDFVFPEQPWGIDHVAFFVRSGDDWRYNGDKQTLLQRKVAMIGGYAYGEEYDQFAEQHKGTSFFFMAGDGALDKNVKKLIANRVDTLVENKLVMMAKMQQMNVANDIQIAGALTEDLPMYLACSPGSDKTQGFIDMANAALPAMKADGSLQKILANYGLQPWW